MIVTGVEVASAGVEGPLSSTCSGSPSSAVTVIASPRMSPNGSPAAGSGRSLIRPTAIFSAITTAPAPAAMAPAASPVTPVILRQLTIRPPARPADHRHPPSRPSLYSRCGYSRVASRDLPGKPRDDVVGQGAEHVSTLLRGRLAP